MDLLLFSDKKICQERFQYALDISVFLWYNSVNHSYHASTIFW